jgi:hypothetical protein
MPRLKRLQQWMQGCLLAAEEPDAGTVRRRIRASSAWSAVDRMGTYRAMYELRLIEALRVDYPGLSRCLGTDGFEELARFYIRQCPSQSYTLNRLGDRLPDFLPRIEGLKNAAFLHDLARFELAETLVFDEQPSSSGMPSGLAANSCLEPVAALRLLVMRYPANRYLKSNAEAIPRRRVTRVVVFRQQYSVAHVELDPREFALCSALCSGMSIAEAVARSTLSQRAIFDCFRRWSAHGWFRAGSSASAVPGD